MVLILKLGEELVATVREQFKAKGLLPDDLFGRLTPSQFVTLFSREPQEQNPDRSEQRLRTLLRMNEQRGREGKRPVIPSWL